MTLYLITVKVMTLYLITAKAMTLYHMKLNHKIVILVGLVNKE